MRSKIQAFIRQESLLQDNDRILVAFSGGADSVALLSVLSSLGYQCLAAHMNFHLRGEESDCEEVFARAFCARKHLPIAVKSVNAERYAAEHSLSIEMAARELRYAWFEELRAKHHLQAIAVGHHADDDVETFFLNLFRGSGPKGLAGIPVKNGYVVRPLLCVSREEILAYLSCHQLDYVVDSSNLRGDYLRNRIRLQLIPLMEEIQPSFRKIVCRSQVLLRASDNDLAQALAPRLQAIRKDGHRLKTAEASESLLYQWLSAYGFNAKEITSIWQQRNATPGTCFQAPKHELLLDREEWLLREKQEKPACGGPFPLPADLSTDGLPLSLQCEYLDAPFSIEKDCCIAYLDADKLQFPLKLRHPEKGDFFYPFGMNGRKLLSDFFTDMKLSRFEKQEVWLLLSGEDIVWVVGHRISQHYGVSSSTQRALRISLL